MLLGVFQKHLAMLKPSLVEAMSRAIVFLGVWAATASIATPATIMLAFLAGNVALFFANLHLARQIVPFRLGLDASTLRLFFSRSWPMALSILFNLIYLKGDIIFLHLFGRPLEEIGQYGAAYKVLDVIAVLPSIVMGLLLPRLTHAWSHNDRDGFVRHLQQAMDTFFVMAIPILVGGAFLANQVMTLVSGEGFAAAGSYLAVLLLANTSVFFGILFGHAVVALGKQKTVLPAYAATAALTTLLYWLWIPRFGATGAAWATVFSETFILLCTYGLVRQATKCVLHLGTAGKSLVAALYMALALIGANTVMTENLSLPYHLQTVLLLAVGVAVYSLLLMALGVLTPRMIRSLLATK
jgi:O-antigen/teichoic acid export membrane protein